MRVNLLSGLKLGIICSLISIEIGHNIFGMEEISDTGSFYTNILTSGNWIYKSGIIWGVIVFVSTGLLSFAKDYIANNLAFVA